MILTLTVVLLTRAVLKLLLIATRRKLLPIMVKWLVARRLKAWMVTVSLAPPSMVRLTVRTRARPMVLGGDT